MLRTSLIALLGILLTPSLALAWDFTCSPSNVIEIEPVDPPNMMLMLDKSGSMDQDGAANACRVCERPDGTFFALSDTDIATVACPTTMTGLWTTSTLVSTVSGSDDAAANISGYSHNFTITTPTTATGSLALELTVQGDFNDCRDRFSIYVDNVFFEELKDISKNCDETYSITLTGLPLGAVSDGTVKVEIRTAVPRSSGSCSRSGNGVDSKECTTLQNKATARLYTKGMTYHGTQSWDDPCGVTSKWKQAYDAIDLMTAESSALDPDLAAFGLGLFSGGDAAIYNECEQDSHDAIMTTLDNNGPNGSTPTAKAIYTARDSKCVKGAISGVITVTDTQYKTKDGKEGFNYVHEVAVPPQTSDTSVSITLNGDYSSSCEYADIYVYDVTVGTKTKIGTHQGKDGDDCKSDTKNFVIPAAATANGKLGIEVRNRVNTWRGSGCSVGKDGVDARCDTNSSAIKLQVNSGVSRTAATVLITDGEPTVGYDGVDARPAAVIAACLHRPLANLYVVGQGGGTDVEFNDILAAAGGTGSCDGGVDPCDDPKGFDVLRGKCTGAYQTSSSGELLAAIAAIANDIQCVFDVRFEGTVDPTNPTAPLTDVPLDTTQAYPYLYIQGRFAGTGNGRIYNKNSMLAVPPNEGWEFASAAESRRVRLSPLYCNMVQTRAINQVATTLACLCSQVPGGACTVPDYDTRGLCPDGVWACDEGTDYCQPDLNCCVADVPCTLPGLLGVCAAGLTVCPASGVGPSTCEQVVFPSTEICNGLDDDCDGDIDEIGGTCTIAGSVGRCAPGFRACSGNSEVCLPQFEPMPELCNGLDDDCDGTKDNLTQSWSALGTMYTLPSADRPKTCDIKNSCVCASGAADNHAGDDFTSYLAEWSNVCVCGEGLEAPEADFTAADEAAVEAEGGDPQASCSAVDGGLAPLGLLAFFGLVRRRRN
jgi:MYXO-CTERM domain-containing protein